MCPFAKEYSDELRRSAVRSLLERRCEGPRLYVCAHSRMCICTPVKVRLICSTQPAWASFAGACLCVYMHVCRSVRPCVCVHIYIYIYTHTHACIYIYTHTPMHVYYATCLGTGTVTVTVTGNLLNTKALTLVSRQLSQPVQSIICRGHTCSCLCVYMHVCALVCVCVYIYIYIYIYTHTHTPACIYITKFLWGK